MIETMSERISCVMPKMNKKEKGKKAECTRRERELVILLYAGWLANWLAGIVLDTTHNLLK